TCKLPHRRAPQVLNVCAPPTRRARERQRFYIVIREQFSTVAEPGLSYVLDPLGGATMEHSPPRAGDLGVGDVVDEIVPEAIFVVTGHRGDPNATDQLLSCELVQMRADVRSVPISDRFQRPRPEHPSDHG